MRLAMGAIVCVSRRIRFPMKGSSVSSMSPTLRDLSSAIGSPAPVHNLTNSL